MPLKRAAATICSGLKSGTFVLAPRPMHAPSRSRLRFSSHEHMRHAARQISRDSGRICRSGSSHENFQRNWGIDPLRTSHTHAPRESRRAPGPAAARIQAHSRCVYRLAEQSWGSRPRGTLRRGPRRVRPDTCTDVTSRPARNPVFGGRAYLRCDAALRRSGFPVRRRVRGERRR